MSKPRHIPCVGCGFCCISVPCMPSLERHGKEDCPELVWHEERGRYVCKLAEELAETLSIGAGCTSNLNSWRRDVKNRDEQRIGFRPRAEVEAAAQAELIGRFCQVWPELGQYLAAVVGRDKNGRKMSNEIDTTEPLRSFTVYYDPADYPGKYVVRGERIYPGLCVKDPEPTYVGDSLADARDMIPLSMAPIPRMTGDPPPIVEVWM